MAKNQEMEPHLKEENRVLILLLVTAALAAALWIFFSRPKTQNLPVPKQDDHCVCECDKK